MKISGSKIFYVITCCLIFFLPSGVFADDLHYVNMLVGNRAAGLGGAYTALSDDPAGCFYNPAGIAFSPYASLSASVNAFSTSTKTYKDAMRDTSENTLDWEQKSSSLLPNFFGLVRKFGPGKLGLSYAVPDSIRRQQKQTFHNIKSIFAVNPIETYTININDNDETYLFGPSYSYKIHDSFSIGATFYIYYRDMEIIRTQLLRFEQGEHTLVNLYETKRAWGYKPILGVIWEPFDKLAIGLSASKIYVASSDHDQQLIFRDTSGTYDFPDDTNAIGFTTISDTEKDKFPLATSLGLAYFASSRLLLSADITYYEEVSDKEAIYNYSLGTEYYFTDSFAVRAGFFSDKANTPSLSSGKANQDEHIDIYGAILSFTTFHKRSSITLGMSYGLGEGEAQVVADSTKVQDAEIKNMNFYISASYSY